jgi:hypothetical protein
MERTARLDQQHYFKNKISQLLGQKTVLACLTDKSERKDKKDETFGRKSLQLPAPPRLDPQLQARKR